MAIKDLSLDIRRSIERYATIYNFNPELLAAIVTAESGGDPSAVSGAGAKGLMQTLGSAPIQDAMRTGLLKEKPDLQTIDGQVQAGTAYLAYLRDFEKAPSLEHLLMMYNGGPKMKGASPTGSAEQLKQYVTNRFGGDFDGVQNANYRDSILKAFQEAGGDASDFSYNTGIVNNINTGIEPASDISDPVYRAAAADTKTVVDSSVTSTNAGTTTDAQPIVVKITEGTSRLDPAQLQGLEAAEAARVATEFETAEQSLRENTAFQEQSVQDLDGRIDNLPATPDYQAILTSTLQELEQFNQRDRQLVDGAFAKLADRDATRRNITANLAERIDYNPTDPDSLLQGVLRDQMRLQQRLRATNEMRQRVGDANPGSAMWLRRVLFGNEYAQGAADLTQMSQQQRTVHNNTMAILKDQIALAEGATLSDPELTTGRLNADLRLNERQAALADRKGNIPLKVYEAEMRVAQQELEREKLKIGAEQNVQEAKIREAELGIKKANAQERARGRAITRQQAVANLENTELRIRSAKRELEVDDMMRSSRLALERIRQAVTTAEGIAKLKELQRLEARLKNPEYLRSQTEAERLELKRRILEARVAVAKNADIIRTGAVGTSVDAQNSSNAATIDTNQRVAISQERQLYAWNDVLGNRNDDGTSAPVPLNLTREDQLALELLANGKAADINPLEAATRLNNMGAFKHRGPTDLERSILNNTAQAVFKAVQGRIEFDDPRRVANMTASEFQAIVGDLVNKRTNITNNAAGINGVLPTRFLVAHAPDARSVDFLTSKAESFDNARTYREKLDVAIEHAKSIGLDSQTDQANFASGIFQAAVKANNDLRGFRMLGLPPQRGMPMLDSSNQFLFLGDQINVDLSSAPELARYMAAETVRQNAVDNNLLDFVPEEFQGDAAGDN